MFLLASGEARKHAHDINYLYHKYHIPHHQISECLCSTFVSPSLRICMQFVAEILWMQVVSKPSKGCLLQNSLFEASGKPPISNNSEAA